MRRIVVSILVVFTALLTLALVGYAPHRPSEETPRVRRLVSELHSASPVQRARAAYELGKLGSEATPAVPALADLLADESEAWLHDIDPDPTRNGDERLSPAILSSEALARIGRRSLPYLSSALRGGPPASRRHAADAIAQIGGDEAMSMLRSALADKDPVARAAAAGAMRRMVDPRLAAVQGVLRDPDRRVRLAAIESVQDICGRSCESEAADRVMGRLHDSDAKVRETAVRAIGYMFTPRTGGQAEVDLLPMLHDSSPAVRMEAAFSLGCMRSRVATRPLIRRLTDGDASVRRKAEWALVSITGEDLGSDPAKWEQWVARSERPKQ